MPAKAKPACRFYYEDYYRGQQTSECRLPKSRDTLRWERNVCDSCPVPDLLRETNCTHLALEGAIRRRRPFGPRMEVFAICTKHAVQLKPDGYCPHCAAEQAALLQEGS